MVKEEFNDIGIIAMNKLCYYMANYPVIDFNVEGETVFLPDFFKAFKPYLLPHLTERWKHINDGSYGRVLEFYLSLDGENRGRMLNYILNNYEDEQVVRLYFPDLEE